ncbi:MAG: peptide deformylase [Bacteroidales bacterium]
MMYPIMAFGHGVLRKKALEVNSDYPNLSNLIGDMFETMIAAHGVGLAAPQINLPIRLVVIDATPFEEDYPEAKKFKKVLINPTILEESGELWVFNEGCLSFPGLHEDVSRASNVLVRYQDENFQWHEEAHHGVVARVIQHELDHLDGKMFIDRLNPLRKTLLKRRLDAISKGDVQTEYRILYPLKSKRK